MTPATADFTVLGLFGSFTEVLSLFMALVTPYVQEHVAIACPAPIYPFSDKVKLNDMG